ncbi:MAG: hypothetical protein ACR2M4_01595 [Actinomycetota bacterium]
MAIPNAPTITVSPSTTLNRVAINIFDGGGAATKFFVERSVNLGAFQQIFANVINTVANPDTVYDYTAPRGVGLRYRARANNLDGTSGYSPIVATTLASDGQAWIKSVFSPGLSAVVCLDTHELESVSTEDQAQYRVTDRAEPVIIAGFVRTEQFDSIPLFFQTKADFTNFEAIRATQRVVLLQTCYGEGPFDQYYLRFADRKVERLTNTVAQNIGKQLYRVDIAAREVKAPISQDA